MYKKIATTTILFSIVGMAIAATTASLFPATAGTYNSWNTSTGTTHYTLVDETSCNGTTDYVNTTTTGTRDSYGISLSSVPVGATITSISITPCASKNKSSGSSVMNVFYRLNGVNSADAGAYSLSGTSPVNLSATTFSGLSVVKNASTTLEIGAVYTSGTGGVRLSNVSTVISYTPAPPVAPSNLSATPLAFGTTSVVRLTWTDNSSDESGFLISRSLDGVNFTHLATTSANWTIRDDSSVAPSTTYYYRINAYNAGGNSAYSNIASTTTLP